MTISSENFFKPSKVAADEAANQSVERAHSIVAEEATARALKTQKLREARLANASVAIGRE